MRCRLRLPTPYDAGWVLGFLGDRAVPALERVDAAGLVRVVRLAGVPTVLELRFEPGAAPPRWLAVEARLAGAASPTATPGLTGSAMSRSASSATPAGSGNPVGSAGTDGRARSAGASLVSPLRRLVRRMLDLDTDLGPFLALARRDPLLAPLAARHPGLRLPQLPDAFEGAVRAIVGQQVSVAGARTMIDRLVRGLGEPLPGTGLFAFPQPAVLAAARPDRIAALGFTRAKAAALIAVAAATAGGTLDWRRLRAAPPAAAQEALVALPGIGPWTASYVRMRALGDRDAFPASDLGVIKALAAHAAPADIQTLAECWRPFRAYAAIHLWRSLSP